MTNEKNKQKIIEEGLQGGTTMQEIKCPKCGAVLPLDENVVTALKNQVRGVAFDEELKARVDAITREMKRENDVLRMELEHESRQAIQEKDLEIAQKESVIATLEARLAAGDTNAKLLVKEAVEAKAAETAAAIDAVNIALQEKIQELNRVTSALENKDALAKMETENIRLSLEKEKNDAINAKEAELMLLNSKMVGLKESFNAEKQNILTAHANEIKLLNETVEYYRDYKLKLSTKGIGESLEKYCQDQFNSIRMTAYPNAYFEKDNEVVDGTKGDFIFREWTPGGEEAISVMFEMKNEADATEKKHKNEDFLDKLDRDRRNKKCEYAVLVSMLEPDSDYYNKGIVDVSYKYPKMFVVRPDYFLVILGILRNAAMNNTKIKDELLEAKMAQIDLTTFELELDNAKSLFDKNMKLAGAHYDNTCKILTKIRDSAQKALDEMRIMKDQLGRANNGLQEITVKKLTKNAPSVRAQLDEIRNLND